MAERIAPGEALPQQPLYNIEPSPKKLSIDSSWEDIASELHKIKTDLIALRVLRQVCDEEDQR